MNWFKLILVAAGLLVLANTNISIDVRTEFEGPLHQFYLDHIRHHQEDSKRTEPSFH